MLFLTRTLIFMLCNALVHFFYVCYAAFATQSDLGLSSFQIIFHIFKNYMLCAENKIKLLFTAFILSVCLDCVCLESKRILLSFIIR